MRTSEDYICCTIGSDCLTTLLELGSSSVCESVNFLIEIYKLLFVFNKFVIPFEKFVLQYLMCVLNQFGFLGKLK